MKAVILAAGASPRLKPFTETRAKPMIRLAGRPIIEFITQSLREAGIRELLMVVSHQRQTLEHHMGYGDNFGLSIEYVHQQETRGIGQALSLCRERLGHEPFLLVYGDVLTTGQPFSRVLERFQETGTPVAAVTLPHASQEFGNVYLDPDMRITRFLEKPQDKRSNYVLAGIFLLTPEIFPLLEQNNLDMARCYQHLVDNQRLNATLWEGGWIDITRPWQILEANRMIMDQWQHAEIHHSVKMRGPVHMEGPVHIEADVVIEAGCVIKGPCYIGQGSTIGNNVLVREYSSLGPKSLVGYGTELKHCVLFGKSELGRLSFIGDSVIGEQVVLGTGVCTVNFRHDQRPITFKVTGEGEQDTGMAKLGAMIGDNVIIGARQILEPGTHIPTGFRAPDLTTLPKS